MCNFCFLSVLGGCFPLQLSPSVLWYYWLGLLTCKNRLPYNLYCVGGDVKHCTTQSKNPLGPKYSLLKKSIWVGPNSNAQLSGLWTKVHRTSFSERGRNRSRSISFPILDILSLCGDIHDQNPKLCIIDPNFACFSPPKFFRGRAAEYLDLHYKNQPNIDHEDKFHGDWPSELGDLVAKLN